MSKILCILALYLVVGSLSLMASGSCYKAYKTSVQPNTEIDTAVFVLIDETTLLDERLKEQVISNTLSKVAPANYFYIAKFSAFIDNKYNEKVFDFLVDVPLTPDQRYNERKDALSKIDKCLKDQNRYVQSNIHKSISKAFMEPENDIAKSDIFYALKDFGINVISQSKAKNKIVIIASDMLENSSITSFYSSGSAREINSITEFKKVEKNDLLSDFGGAKIYVIGSGIVSTKVKNKTYRDPKILASLKTFWSEYFQKSNANLIEMGQPALKQAIE